MAALRWGCRRYFGYAAAFGGPYPKTSGVDIPTVLLIHFERQLHLIFMPLLSKNARPLPLFQRALNPYSFKRADALAFYAALRRGALERRTIAANGEGR